MQIKPEETKLKVMESSISTDVNTLRDLDTGIIIKKLEENLNIRLTAKDMFEVLK